MKTRILNAARGFRNWAHGMLFPEGITCLCCGRVPQNELTFGICEACALALDAQRIKQDAQPPRECPPELAFVHAAFSYEEPARKLICMLKYERIRSAAQPLISAMAMLPSGEEDVLVPVPTTAKRLSERGFNQSFLLAQGIGDALGMEVLNALERVGEQREQAGLSGKERLENLAGCMRAKMRLDGRRVLLVDDVYTTGTTAREAARALFEAGAVSVGVFAAARALEKEDSPPFLLWGR